jgi:hypothetical protein
MSRVVLSCDFWVVFWPDPVLHSDDDDDDDDDVWLQSGLWIHCAYPVSSVASFKLRTLLLMSVSVLLLCVVAQANWASLIWASQAILWPCGVYRSLGRVVPPMSSWSCGMRSSLPFCHSCMTPVFRSLVEICASPVLSCSISFQCLQKTGNH